MSIVIEDMHSGTISETRPCPFCGSLKVSVRFYNQPSVVCLHCLAMGPATSKRIKNGDDLMEFRKEAIRLWNGRS